MTSAEISLFILVLAAVLIGWIIGRLERRPKTHRGLPQAYIAGLNFVMGQSYDDQAFERFVIELSVSEQSFDMHIMLAGLLRQRGEVERAIRMHQNLISHPSLSEKFQLKAQFELAEDYMSAGLYDRAEGLYQKLLLRMPEQASLLKTQLIEIYRLQSDWLRAADLQLSLEPKRGLFSRDTKSNEIRQVAAHFYCEYAETMFAEGNLRRAYKYVQRALNKDKNCIRALLLLAEIEVRYHKPEAAIKTLDKVQALAPEFTLLALSPLAAAFKEIAEPKAHLQHLQKWSSQNDSTALAIALADVSLELEGDVAAYRVLNEHVKHRPVLKALRRLLALSPDQVLGQDSDKAAIFTQTLTALDEQHSSFQCRSCGFNARHIFWNCPSCKRWDSVKPVIGLTGD